MSLHSTFQRVHINVLDSFLYVKVLRKKRYQYIFKYVNNNVYTYRYIDMFKGYYLNATLRVLVNA